jgi:hypothetical protein
MRNMEDVADQVPTHFWEVIASARQDPQRFRAALAHMDRESLTQFGWTYEELAAQLRSRDHARYAHQDLSEDGLAELANWIVALGRESYLDILEHPDRMPGRHADSGFMSELIEEFEERFSDDFPYNDRSWDPDWRAKGKPGPWS